MHYVGSKRRHAKHMLPIILESAYAGQTYVEPFVGGANMIDKVRGKRIGADSNINTIILLQAIQNNWIPPKTLSESLYKELKAQVEPSPLKSFAGFCCSFGAKWFGGYANCGVDADGNPRNRCGEARRHLLKQRGCLKGIDFVH